MTTRRDFIKSSGYLVVGVAAAANADLLGGIVEAQGAGPYIDPDFRQLDSWIVIRDDNTATFFVGKTDLGQGTGTAFRQIMADEVRSGSLTLVDRIEIADEGGNAVTVVTFADAVRIYPGATK